MSATRHPTPTNTRVQYHWPHQTIGETFSRIGSDLAFPWLAIGDFLDDWCFTAPPDRPSLVQEAIAPVDDAEDHGTVSRDGDLSRWAAFCAALAEWLCQRDELPVPEWTQRATYRLAEPWFLYPIVPGLPGEFLRAWQLEQTPAPFARRNIFGDEQMVSRV